MIAAGAFYEYPYCLFLPFFGPVFFGFLNQMPEQRQKEVVSGIYK